MEETKDIERLKVYRGILNYELATNPQNLDQNLENGWKIIKNSITKSAKVFKKENIVKIKSSWFNDRCKEAITKRTEARRKMIEDPSPENIEEFINNKKNNQ